MDNAHSIYIFDLNTGRIITRLSGLPEVISHIIYSKDGRYLAVGLGSDNGIMVYRTEDYSLVKEDPDYGDSVYGMDFSQDGRLVATSDDGYIRLNDKNFKLIKQIKAPGGERPHHVSFSPDGSRIAVGYGYDDTTNVDVLSSDDFDKLYSADTKDFFGCNFGSVSFSSDGLLLYAGGWCGKPFILRRWHNARKGAYIDFPLVDNTIFQLLPVKNGGLLFCSAEPSFGILDANGKLSLYKKMRL